MNKFVSLFLAVCLSLFFIGCDEESLMSDDELAQKYIAEMQQMEPLLNEYQRAELNYETEGYRNKMRADLNRYAQMAEFVLSRSDSEVVYTYADVNEIQSNLDLADSLLAYINNYEENLTVAVGDR